MTRTYRAHSFDLYGKQWLKQFPHWRSEAQRALHTLDELEDYPAFIRPRYARPLVSPNYYDYVLLASETIHQRRRAYDARKLEP